MDIQRIGALSPVLAPAGVAAPTAAAGAGADFGRTLTDLLGKLGATERGTDQLMMRAAAGDNVDIHDVMIATQAESLAFQVGLQVRNKLVDAYHEIFRMQM
jgi:flagellar hook-basal body complex protein FliE